MMQELNYIRCGDYYIPDIRLPEENRPIGRWGRMHRDYIKEHVLKQVVDQNIWRLKQLKLLPSASQAAAEEDYNREPPPDIDWPTDEEAKFTWFYYEMLKLNKDGARVLLKGKIDFAEHHYETECTVRWNESLSETAIKNASITSVVDSQEKELAAAI